MRFRTREQAAELLADRLVDFRGRRPLVLGIPRGGVPMARVIADRLEGDLDVVLVHKLRAPFQPELALGSIDEAGRVYLNRYAHELGIERGMLELEEREQLARLRQRRARYTAARPPIDPAGRIVIIVDDGFATGSTVIAAIRSARAQNAAQIVVAAAVAPPETLRRLAAEADAVVCLHAPEDFRAVGAFFDDFSEVTDEQVIALLSDAWSNAERGGTTEERT